MPAGDWLPAEPLEPLSGHVVIITAGTSAQDEDGTWFGYVRWTPVAATVTQGKAFAIYIKPGQPADAGSFVRQGVVVHRVSSWNVMRSPSGSVARTS